ncbi:Elongator complex protein 4 [Phialemonium atrogriseum]|uniref:Elongator complex protein 4 n=1 Tax=Phialemonium atrogriseum TaxID=1093897 RepID=A0AAJ0BYD7_9PEZI|nr:Elongator complex protein 4 [Phialemonium atrogriseum]KAK1766778.1 Elongator complex protein 4 [Phialemonium atrogriseum]
MSFRKRNTVISTAPTGQAALQTKIAKPQPSPGLRPSPVDGRLTMSTGTSSLDHLLAGHVGLPLGTSLLVEEQGTTDFSGVLLRYYAAEGLVQGHQVHVLGFSEAWAYELPALSAVDGKSKTAQPARPSEEKMKIAWRYEALANNPTPGLSSRGGSQAASTFCHSFDLTKRLASGSIKGAIHATPSASPMSLSLEPSGPLSPFKAFLGNLQAKLAASDRSVIHRVVIPSLLSPTLYTSGSCAPGEVLQFLHGLRALLRQYSAQVTALLALPISLFPRSSGLTRWMELLCDGVIELVPLPANSPALSAEKLDSKSADQNQGLLRVHSLPIYHEKGGGGAEGNHFRENLTFSLSASKGLVIKPFSLPPLGEEGQKEKSPASTVKDGMDF